MTEELNDKFNADSHECPIQYVGDELDADAGARGLQTDCNI